jgi:hypothetical protein
MRRTDGSRPAALAPAPAAPDIRPMSSLRMPQSLARRLGVETGEAVLRYELVEEQAHTLGRAGRKAEAALQALRDHPGGDGRAVVLKAAADAVWAFFVQREILGLRDRAGVIAEMGIPREVMVRLGAR